MTAPFPFSNNHFLFIQTRTSLNHRSNQERSNTMIPHTNGDSNGILAGPTRYLIPVDEKTPTDAAEKMLVHFFKCTKFRSQCYWSGDSCSEFIEHTRSRHPEGEIWCIYCSLPHEDQKVMYKTGKALADHIITAHGFRIYQCNLCVYRAAYLEHLELHHATYHNSSYLNAIENPELAYTASQSRIYKCSQIYFGPKPNEDIFYLTKRAAKINSGTGKYQCFYCNFMDLERYRVYLHISKVHPDVPMLVNDHIDEEDIIEVTVVNSEGLSVSLPDDLKAGKSHRLHICPFIKLIFSRC